MPYENIIRVSVSEAARLFGVNAQTIRRAITDGQLLYAVVGGRYKVNFESLVKWSQNRPTVTKKTNTRGIGQFVDKWKIKNKLYSPNPQVLKKNNLNNSANTEHPTQISDNPPQDTLPI